MQNRLKVQKKWPKSLIEFEESGKKAFIPFPKPTQDIGKCKRWLMACFRQFFTEKNVSRSTYICGLHWLIEKGPTTEHPDPLKANLRPSKASCAHARKRKAPKPRSESVRKKELHLEENCVEELDVSLPINELEESNHSVTSATDSTAITDDVDVGVHVYENPVTGNLVADQGS